MDFPAIQFLPSLPLELVTEVFNTLFKRYLSVFILHAHVHVSMLLMFALESSW